MTRLAALLRRIFRRPDPLAWVPRININVLFHVDDATRPGRLH